jgi:ArsR family transcriptional regulator, arsenate/arsenite/antimonite-responsive transcriptional repressor
MNQVPTNELDRSARLFKALSDPVRLRLLNLLAGNREVCVCHLHGALQLPQPMVSRHLAYLRRAGLVAGRKDGLWVHYRLAKSPGPLHKALLICIPLADQDAFYADLARLARMSSCCE